MAVQAPDQALCRRPLGEPSAFEFPILFLFSPGYCVDVERATLLTAPAPALPGRGTGAGDPCARRVIRERGAGCCAVGQPLGLDLFTGLRSNGLLDDTKRVAFMAATRAAVGGDPPAAKLR